jgi:hypothetical protein
MRARPPRVNEIVSKPEKQVPATSPTEALDTVYRDLVAVHYVLAEHGPTDPKMASSWAMCKVRGVLDYIQAVKRAQPTSSQE